MKRLWLVVLISGFLVACGGAGNGGAGGGPPPPSNDPFWAQWGSNPQHSGMVNVAGMNLANKLADIVYDPFVPQESAESGRSGEAVLTAHYQAPITDGNDVYMVSKSGTYTSCNPVGQWRRGMPCGPNTWNTMIWNESRFTWESGQLKQIWTFQSDWKPEPNATNFPNGFGGLFGWEPVFHAIEANGFIYVPGAGGAIWKVNKTDGSSASHIMPFGALDANIFVSGPLAADASGNIFYNVIKLEDPTIMNPWAQADVQGAWLVKVTQNDGASLVPYSTLVPDAPLASGNTCPGTFFQVDNTSNGVTLPWPPAGFPPAPGTSCGSQRPGVNVAPAIAPDGTIYTVSVAHFNQLESFLIAVHPDLTPKWDKSLQSRLHDGCGVDPALPISADPNQSGACRVGTRLGVDPTTNDFGSGGVIDESSSSPMVVSSDGSILYGAVSNYANGRGHLFKFDSNGNFLSAYSFGWDSTPAVYSHGGTYSVVIKDNHYDAPAYCGGYNNPICATPPRGPYFITQVSADLRTIEWQFKNPTVDPTHPMGFEWCINAPAIDSNGIVYANSEDGNIYTIDQTGAKKQNIFLHIALGAAYTPLSLGSDGKVYTENDGHLIAVGM